MAQVRRNGQIITLHVDVTFDEVEDLGLSSAPEDCVGGDTDNAFRNGRSAYQDGKSSKAPKRLTSAARHAWSAGYEWQERYGKQPKRKAAAR